jgi:poly(3-hydroxybutyrate) depolymerase
MSQAESADSFHIVHDECDQNVRVEHYRVNETGHGWPESINGVPTYQIIWSFLSSFSKPDYSSEMEDLSGSETPTGTSQDQEHPNDAG